MLKVVIVCCGSLFLSLPVSAQEVPTVSDDPVINQTLDKDMFDFVTKTLSSGKMAPHLQCTLKTRVHRELRKFSDGEEWVEILEVTFNSNGWDSGHKMQFKIPANARYGVRRSSNQWSGTGEDIKINLEDYYGHWLRFTHDGQGRIVQLMLGNNLKTTPCQTK